MSTHEILSLDEVCNGVLAALEEEAHLIHTSAVDGCHRCCGAAGGGAAEGAY